MDISEVIVKIPDKDGKELRLQLVGPTEYEPATVSLMDVFNAEEVGLLPEQARRMAGALNLMANITDRINKEREAQGGEA